MDFVNKRCSSSVLDGKLDHLHRRYENDKKIKNQQQRGPSIDMPGTSNIARTLRSKKTVKDHEVEKFDFDKEEFEIPPEQKLKVISRGKLRRDLISDVPKLSSGEASSNGVVGSNRDVLSDLQEKTQKISDMILDISKHRLADVDASTCEDMLPDTLYCAFHKHMQRQENRMLEMDIAEGEAEAERLHLLSEKLDMIHWPITLRQVTVINDFNDEEECSRKKELTKKCIRTMLDNFEAMKQRRSMVTRGVKRNRIDPARDLPKVYNKVDRRLVINYNSSSDDEEEGISAEDIRRHRRQKRQEECRGSVIIQLSMKPNVANLKYAIIAEPLRKPYVIKVSQAERKTWRVQMENAPKKFEYNPPLANQTAKFKRKVTIPLTLSAKDENHSRATISYPSADHEENCPAREVIKKAEDNDYHAEAKKNSRIHSPPIRKKRRL